MNSPSPTPYTEEQYIRSCYGTRADMPRFRVTKDGHTLECHSAAELQAMIDDGWQSASCPRIH